MLLLVGVLSGLLLVAWLTVHWAILPHIQQWRGWVEERASQAIGLPVRIGRIEARTRGWVPSFELQEVTLQGPDGRPAMRLARVRAAVSPRSLLARQLDFAQLLIEGPELEVRRDPAGHVFIAGIDVGRLGAEPRPDAPRDNPFADWLFRQKEVIVRGGELRWIDEQRGPATPQVFGQVQLVARNGLRQHALRLDATPPPAWGERFSVVGRFTQPLLARAGDWSRWKGSVYADLPHAELAGWQRQLGLPGGASGGAGAVRAWVEVADGSATAATVDLALAGVSLPLGPEVRPLTLTRVAGRLIAQRDRHGASVEARQLRFATADGLDWAGGDLKLAWRQRDGEPPSGGTFRADHLDLGLAARIATSCLPPADARRALLADWRPEGIADDLKARWDDPPGAALHYHVEGRLSGLSLAAKPSPRAGGIGRPGVRNASLQLDAGEGGGSARLEVANGSIELPGVFDEPVLPFDRLGGRLVWEIAPRPLGEAAQATPGITVQFQGMRFANRDAHGRFDGRWSNQPPVGAGRSRRLAPAGHLRVDDRPDLGRLELDGQLADGVASRLHRYLPLALPSATRSYLQDAIRAGRLTTASVHIRGPLRTFPYFKPAPATAAEPGAGKAADGEFRILAHADDLGFAYVPGPAGAASAWPLLSDASADLSLERGTFTVRNGHGRIGGLDWGRIAGSIEHLGGEEALLTVDAAATGPLAEMVRVVNASPVGAWLGGSLARAAATGRAGVAMTLGLPLLHIDTGATLTGSLTLAGDNDLRFTPDSPLLGQARGRVDFSRTGFALVAAGAQVYGGDAAVEGGTRPDGSIGFAAHGEASADGLRRASELGPVTRFATALAGRTAYRANLVFRHGRPELSVASDLVGMAIDLPAPLAKPPELPLAMQYRMAQEPGVGTDRPRESLQFDLGDEVQAHYLRETTGDSPRVLRGGIGVRAAAPAPASGVAAHLRLDSLDVDAWQAAYDRMFPAGEVASGSASGSGSASASLEASAIASSPPPPSTGGPPAPADAGAGYQPDAIALQVDELRAGSRRLTHLTAGLSQPRPNGLWRANLDADQLAGYVEYRPPRPAAAGGSAMGGAGRVYARLSRLALPKSDADQVSSLLDERPATVPALDVVVDDLELNGLALGRVEVQASNRPAGSTGPTGERPRDASRDWQLTKFTMTTPEAQLLATGRWAAPSPAGSSGTAATAAAPRRMVLDFKLQVADGGALLDRLGTRSAIRGGRGELSGEVAWLGSPFALDYPSLSGEVKIRVGQGQFLKVDPGAARLLGVLSLQSLPRRLSLDFRDLFDRGFAFDEISGDLAIARGVARSRNLRMRGVQAAVLMEGSADIERETQDLRVVVVPEINAGTAALAYAVINPAIGIGAFVAQALLKKPLTAAGTREFHIVGPWADPKVLPVAHRPDEPVPEPAEPPASAASVQNP